MIIKDPLACSLILTFGPLLLIGISLFLGYTLGRSKGVEETYQAAWLDALAGPAHDGYADYPRPQS